MGGQVSLLSLLPAVSGKISLIYHPAIHPGSKQTSQIMRELSLRPRGLVIYEEVSRELLAQLP